MRAKLLLAATLLISTQAQAVLVSTDCRDRVKAQLQALSNFPAPGRTVNIIDDRAILAICTALQQWITQTGTVIPGTLNNPVGQAVQVNLSNGLGATIAPQVIQGIGVIQ